jgi:hypothetical protein
VTGTNPLGTGVTGLTLDLLAERIAHERELREANEKNADTNLKTATTSMDKRLESMNEFRATLTEQNRTFVTVTVFDSKIDAQNNRITLLERAGERTSGAIATWRFLAGSGGVLSLIAIALYFLHPGAACASPCP